jgi:CSLREA domain-containing protein
MARRHPGCLFLSGILCCSTSLSASVFVTTRLDDAPVDGCATNGCTLREAVIAANGGGGPHRVELGVRGRYELTIPGANENAAATGDLDLLASMEIGPPPGTTPSAAAYVVDANGIDRVFDARPPAGGSILLRGMTITGGSATLANGESGGGVYAEPGSGSQIAVRIEDSAIVGNQANLGGGIGTFEVSLTVERTAISGNHAVTVGSQGVAGGAFMSLGSARFVRSTIAGNDATGGGGALGWTTTAAVSLEQSTIAGNFAPFGTVFFSSSIDGLQIRDSILSGDCTGFSGSESALSGGGNVESPGDTCGLGPADQVGISGAALGLGALEEQGGAAPTMALASSSPARNRVPAARCAAFDQRDFQRLAPGDAACDAGAWESIGFCRSPNLAIPDNNPSGIVDTLHVDESFVVPDLDLWARIDHTWVGDLKVQLTHTGGGAVSSLLVDRPGLPGFPGGCGDDNLNLKLDDSAATAVESGCSNTQVVGTPAYAVAVARPGDPPASLLTSFAGAPIAGDWAIAITDLGAADTGTLVEWCLLPNGNLFSDGFESGSVGAWSAALPPGLPQLVNPAFELGHLVWAENSTNFPGAIIVQQGDDGAPAALSPPRLVWLGGVASDVSEISQRIAVPVGSGPAYLHFSYQMASDETNCSVVTPSDVLSLQVNGVQVSAFVVCSTYNTGAVWTALAFATNFADYAGQTVDVTIRVTNDGALPSSVYLDSLSLDSTPPTLAAAEARHLPAGSGLSPGAPPIQLPWLRPAKRGELSCDN